jgi:putative endonuclease
MKQFTSKTQLIGKIGEDICERLLKHQKYKILERNFTCKEGEIDIVTEKNNILHFIEVKSTINNNTGFISNINPAENMTLSKIKRCQKAMLRYLHEHNVSHETLYQLDLYLIYIDATKERHKVEFFQNIF